LENYPKNLKNSWVYEELYQVRNIRPAFRYGGLFIGLLHAAIDSFLLRGKAKWTWHHCPDHKRLREAKLCKKIIYPKPDGKVSFDKLSSLFLANTGHTENQRAHLTLRDSRVPIAVNLPRYDAPEQRYCPANVYEIVEENGEMKLRINDANCVHCKTCDIKDPTQNIVWKTPEGGSGPNYSGM
jgi:electron-transferring-flavoprotein dehydrogenase